MRTDVLTPLPFAQNASTTSFDSLSFDLIILLWYVCIRSRDQAQPEAGAILQFISDSVNAVVKDSRVQEDSDENQALEEGAEK